MKSPMNIAIAVVGTLLAPAAARADVVTFAVSGSFQDGSTLSGFVNINTTTGLFASADLSVSTIPVHFTSLETQRTFPLSGAILSEFMLSNGQSVNNQLTILFPPVSLAGYSGGLLCGTSNAPACFDGTLHYLSNYASELPDHTVPANTFVDVISGTLSPVATPEPAPGALVLGLGGVIIFERARRRNAPVTRCKAGGGLQDADSLIA